MSFDKPHCKLHWAEHLFCRFQCLEVLVVPWLETLTCVVTTLEAMDLEMWLKTKIHIGRRKSRESMQSMQWFAWSLKTRTRWDTSVVWLWSVVALWCCYATKTCFSQVSLVALGPLTNLALAVRLDPCFPQKLKALYIMGGNMEGKTTTWLQCLYLRHVGSYNLFLSL